MKSRWVPDEAVTYNCPYCNQGVRFWENDAMIEGIQIVDTVFEHVIHKTCWLKLVRIHNELAKRIQEAQFNNAKT